MAQGSLGMVNLSNCIGTDKVIGGAPAAPHTNVRRLFPCAIFSAHRPTAGEMLNLIRRLQRANDYLRLRREILKKAMSILSEDPQSGMR